MCIPDIHNTEAYDPLLRAQSLGIMTASRPQRRASSPATIAARQIFFACFLRAQSSPCRKHADERKPHFHIQPLHPRERQMRVRRRRLGT